MIVHRSAAPLVGALLLLLPFSDSVADLATAIRECNATVVNVEDASQILVGHSCPGLIEEIESSQWRETLAPGWQEGFSFAQLSEFEYFASYYDQGSFAGSELSLLSLDEIVRSLGKAEVIDNKSLWEQFVDWFSGLQSDKSDQTPGWLTEWLSNVELSSLAIEIVFWSLSALVVAAAIGIIVTEIKAARDSLPTTVPKTRNSTGRAELTVNDRLLTLEDVNSAALDDKPSLLLRLVLQRLESLGEIPYNPARTHREVSRAAIVLGSDGLHVVSRVSESAERIRFSCEKNRPQEIDEVVSAGIALVGNLKPRQA